MQEAPEHCFGSVLAFRTTSGQLGLAFGLAGSGTMVSGFGFNTLPAQLQRAGVRASQIPNLDQQVRLFLRNSPMALDDRVSNSLMPLLREGYSSGMAATMLVVAALTGLLLTLSLLLLIVGREQQLLHQEEL